MTNDSYFHTDEYGRLHREDGPAVISKTGRYYYVKGKRHRMGGPAVITNDREEYWEDGRLIKIKLKNNATTESVNAQGHP